MPSETLTNRLNKVLPRITEPGFLSGAGIGNEIPFYLFDYPAEGELEVRDHIDHLVESLPKRHPELEFIHINLFEILLDYIRSRGHYDKWMKLEHEKGSERALKAIRSIATAERLSRYFAETELPKQPQLIIFSRVGSVFPIVRTHELLNNLQPYTALTPVVIFYPGVYDGTTLKLFDKASLAYDTSSNDRKRRAKYYRAFRLVD